MGLEWGCLSLGCDTYIFQIDATKLVSWLHGSYWPLNRETVFLHPSISPSIHRSIHLFVHRFIQSSIHPFKHLPDNVTRISADQFTRERWGDLLVGRLPCLEKGRYSMLQGSGVEFLGTVFHSRCLSLPRGKMDPQGWRWQIVQDWLDGSRKSIGTEMLFGEWRWYPTVGLMIKS